MTRSQVNALRAQLHDLEVRLAATGTSPTDVHVAHDTKRLELTRLYSESIALSAMRRDQEHMRAVFDRHRDVEHGMSRDALIAALREVDAPVISKEPDAVLRLADTNMNGLVEFDE